MPALVVQGKFPFIHGVMMLHPIPCIVINLGDHHRLHCVCLARCGVHLLTCAFFVPLWAMAACMHARVAPVPRSGEHARVHACAQLRAGGCDTGVGRQAEGG